MSWTFPDPDKYISLVQELCKPETGAALFIAAKRDQGVPQANVFGTTTQQLPDKLRLSHVVIENVEDLYTYTKANALTYYIFRGQACAQEKAQGKPIRAFSTIAEGALKCQVAAGVEPTQPLTSIPVPVRQSLAKCIWALMP